MIGPTPITVVETIPKGKVPQRPTRKNNSRKVVLAVLSVVVLTGSAVAAMRILGNDVRRVGTEQHIAIKLYAPFGSISVMAGTMAGIIARLEMQSDDAGDDAPMHIHYGISNDGVKGNLHISVGDDEGQLQRTPPLAMWRASSNFSLINANVISGDNGSSHSYGLPTGFGEVRMIPQPLPHQQSTDFQSRLFITRDLPVSLNAQLGFGQSFLDLSGLMLEKAYVETGASKVRVTLHSLNPMPMELYQVSAGVGQCNVDGICFSNAGKFEFNGGIGYYDLSFNGKLQRNMDASISVGLGKVSINIPPEAGRVQVFYDDGFFSSFNFSGLAVRRSGYASSAGFDQSTAPILTLHLSSGMGKMNISYH
jgi:hypothetical protein